VPDIGDFEDVEVVEILVAKGDAVELEDSLVSLESDKATMEIPSPARGEVLEVRVGLGDRVSEGSVLAVLSSETAVDVPAPADEAPVQDAAPASRSEAAPTTDAESVEEEEVASRREPGESVTRPPPVPDSPTSSGAPAHASPLVRRYARELGVDLGQAHGSGPHGRILEQDVKAHVRSQLTGGLASGEGGLPALPSVDHARFGAVEEVPLGKIRRASATNLRRSWLNLPHVTQHDEADVTELEAFRRSVAAEAKARGVRLSPLHFVMKAVCIALREQPDFRSSLAPDGERLIVKQYYNLGIAVDTEHGLVVPVVRDVEKKGVYALAEELGALADRARARKLAPTDMQGGTMTISSLGGIGGTAFTPIVNAPEVAVLGLSKLSVQPVWSGGLDLGADTDGAFEPRVLLPLSLSYDHRVIDGAEGARFTARLAELLAHPANLLL
jgi:pyruvate dehydrogenase E2 component (dihydrolipoamide acetyltransferase)